MQKDPEMRDLARQEETELGGEQERLEKTLKELLMPKDPNDDKNIILEIRAGTGGEEAALFAADLFRMYTRFAERRRWAVEILSMSNASAGGIKEVHGRHHRAGRLRAAQVRIGRAPRAARPRHRGAGAHPHVDRDRRGDARGRGRRDPHRPQGPQDRRDAFGRTGRAVGQHDRLRGAHPPHPERPHRPLPAGEVAAQEQGDGDEAAAREAVRHRGREARRPPSATRAAARSDRAIAPRRSAPTTSRRTA